MVTAFYRLDGSFAFAFLFPPFIEGDEYNDSRGDDGKHHLPVNASRPNQCYGAKEP